MSDKNFKNQAEPPKKNTLNYWGVSGVILNIFFFIDILSYICM